MKDRSRFVSLALCLMATAFGVIGQPMPAPPSTTMAALEPSNEPSEISPTMPGCTGNNVWVGNASSNNPNLVTPQCSAGGVFDATLACDSGAADLDLYLEAQSCGWFGCGFSSVEASATASCEESLSTVAVNGTYRWRINHYSGPPEPFFLCTNQC